MGQSWMGLLLLGVFVIRTDAECHCANQTACVVFPSTPCSQLGDPDRCQEGWFGSYCQKQNIALRKFSTQSSTFTGGGFGADRGVDGTPTTSASPTTCAHTQQETNPTWTVNLNTPVPEKIQHIRLYLRQGYLHRNNGMEILVGSQMCYNWSSTEHPPAIADVTCRQRLTGTTVTVRIPGQQKSLTLCEVQIFVCSDGWFSEDCDKQCLCLSSNDICDKITGRCSSGCFPGYHGADCQTGKFTNVVARWPGSTHDSHVFKMSNLQQHLETNHTTLQNGVILGDSGYACPPYLMTPNLKPSTPEQERFNPSHKRTRSTVERAFGWLKRRFHVFHGENRMCPERVCTLIVCPDGFFGINCAYHCGNCLNGPTCNKTTGTCPGGCAAGWMNDDTNVCMQPCPAGSFGINCTSQCENCLSGVTCDKTTGVCPGGCAAGWMRDDTKLCRQPCQDGFYGANCASQCGNCLDSVICNKKNGTCPGGCAAGWVNDGTCLQLAPTEEGFNWGLVAIVAVVLCVLLIITVIVTTIYIRRVLKQLESLKNKTSEEHYVTLDDKTKVPATESTYEHITNPTPYYNSVDSAQIETG